MVVAYPIALLKFLGHCQEVCLGVNFDHEPKPGLWRSRPFIGSVFIRMRECKYCENGRMGIKYSKVCIPDAGDVGDVGEPWPVSSATTARPD